jgi:hypothetical protein
MSHFKYVWVEIEEGCTIDFADSEDVEGPSIQAQIIDGNLKIEVNKANGDFILSTSLSLSAAK